MVRREQVERLVREHVKAGGENPLWVGQDAMNIEFGYALQHGLISREDYDEARRWYGDQFNYGGS